MNRSFLYGFPFLIYLSKIEKPKTKALRLEDSSIRVYPPFLGRDYENTTASLFNPEEIPFNLVSKKKKNIRFQKSYISTHDNNMVEIANCIRIDILDRSNINKQSKLADHVIKYLLSHIRNECNQWEIGFKELYGDYYVGHFESNEKGDQNSEIVYYTPFHTHNRGQVLTDSLWKKIMVNIRLSAEPDIVKELVLDAYNFLVNTDYSRMILSLTWALEIYRDQILEVLWGKLNKKGAFKSGKVLSGNNLTHHLDIDMKKFCGESFKETHAKEYNDICNIWNFRNNVAHGKSAFCFTNGIMTYLDNENSLVLYESTHVCINWLSSLNSKNFDI